MFFTHGTKKLLFVQISGIALIGALVLVPGRSEAYGQMESSFDASAQRMPSFFKQLDLSTEQQEKAKAIWGKELASTKENWKKLKANREAEQSLVEAPKFDSTKAQTLVDDDAKIIAANHLASLRARHDIYQLLSPAQRNKFEALKLERLKEIQE